MAKRKKEILALVLTFLIGVFTNIATTSLPHAWQNYLWLSWLPLGFCIIAVIVLQFFANEINMGSKSKNRHRMLDRVETFWIKDMLDNSLRRMPRIELTLRYVPEAIHHPMGAIVGHPRFSKQYDIANTSIVEIFDQFGGELLIIGAPGSGKTTLLLELTKALISRSRLDDEFGIPVVFNLSTWSEKREPIQNWLIEELNIRYDVPMKICQEWVNNNMIIPLLDGLDEVKNEYRDACVQSINLFRKKNGLLPLLVCCRENEYFGMKTKLRLQGCIAVQSLTNDQVISYLELSGKSLPSISKSLNDDPILLEILNTPLMLSILSSANHEELSDTLDLDVPISKRRQRLLDNYVEAMYQRHSKKLKMSQTQFNEYLCWIAEKMMFFNHTVFYIEGLQPTWLHNETVKKLYFSWVRFVIIVICLLLGIFAGLLLGSVGYILSSNAIIVLYAVALSSLLGLGCSAGLVGTLNFHQIKSAERLQWSWIRAIQQFFDDQGSHLGSGVSAGFFFGVATGFAVGVSFGFSAGLAAAVIGFLGGGLGFSIGGGLTVGNLEVKVVPNQGIRRSFRTAVLTGLCFGMAGMLGGGIGGALIAQLAVTEMSVTFAVLGGVVFGVLGLLAGLWFGGLVCIQHYILRIFLFLTGVAPWHLEELLNSYVHSIIMNKVGGGYIFIHRILMEYYALDHVNPKHKNGSSL